MVSRIVVDNKIKETADVSWLTPSQKESYNELNKYVNGIHKVINLYGSEGVGKTFLAHLLIKKGIIDYVTSPESITASNLPLAIDNSPFERSYARGIRNTMRRYNLLQVIIISRYRVDDSIPVVQLNLNQKDIEHFKSNIFRCFDIKVTGKSSGNLWDFMKRIGE
jgi:hypothetical protein